MVGTAELGGHGTEVALGQCVQTRCAAREPRGARSRGDLQELADVGGVALRSSVSFHGDDAYARTVTGADDPATLGLSGGAPVVVLASLGGARLRASAACPGRSSPRRARSRLRAVEVLGGAVLVVELGDADRAGHRDAGGNLVLRVRSPTSAPRSTAPAMAVSGHEDANSSPPSRATKSLGRSRGARTPAHAQHRITGVVPVEVVDRLEVVEVAHDDRQRLAGAAVQELARKALLPRPPVADRRERVLSGELVEPGDEHLCGDAPSSSVRVTSLPPLPFAVHLAAIARVDAVTR